MRDQWELPAYEIQWGLGDEATKSVERCYAAHDPLLDHLAGGAVFNCSGNSLWERYQGGAPSVDACFNVQAAVERPSSFLEVQHPWRCAWTSGPHRQQPIMMSDLPEPDEVNEINPRVPEKGDTSIDRMMIHSRPHEAKRLCRRIVQARGIRTLRFISKDFVQVILDMPDENRRLKRPSPLMVFASENDWPDAVAAVAKEYRMESSEPAMLISRENYGWSGTDVPAPFRDMEVFTPLGFPADVAVIYPKKKVRLHVMIDNLFKVDVSFGKYNHILQIVANSYYGFTLGNPCMFTFIYKRKESSHEMADRLAEHVCESLQMVRGPHPNKQ